MKTKLIVFLGVMGLMCSLAPAAGVWTGGGIDTNWGTAGNWDDGVVPPAGSDVTIGTGGSTAAISGWYGARIGALATAGEVLVSSTVKDLVNGSGIVFNDRGTHVLKGVPGK